MPLKPFTLRLNAGRQVPAVRIAPDAALHGLRMALGLPRLGGALAVVGGAASFDQPEYRAVRERVHQHLNALADLAIQHRLAIVDGGTPFGAMKLVGQICYAHHYQFPLIGVAPAGRVAWSTDEGLAYPDTWFAGADVRAMIEQRENETEELAPLDEHHAAFVLVEANEWGDETEMLARVTRELAGAHMLEILINGGMIARKDAAAFIRLGGHVLVLDGSGRFSDELARAYHQGHSPDPDIQTILDSGRVHLFHVGEAPDLFVQKVAALGEWTVPTA